LNFYLYSTFNFKQKLKIKFKRNPTNPRIRLDTAQMSILAEICGNYAKVCFAKPLKFRAWSVAHRFRLACG